MGAKKSSFVKPVKLKKLTPEQVKALFDEDTWKHMLELFEESKRIGRRSPVAAFSIQRHIIKKYAEPVIGQKAEIVLEALNRELKNARKEVNQQG